LFFIGNENQENANLFNDNDLFSIVLVCKPLLRDKQWGKSQWNIVNLAILFYSDDFVTLAVLSNFIQRLETVLDREMNRN
jgi:hypothetical protein